ncbi:hypothetical protein KQX54_021869 [Cotesia glomerata]|uniref:Uncharacterized protein n=1 Tax=Cotesia glomerata TaxID=32391 RepID=A0AAV7J8E4_COTGL|nr:hypothetical protein KQX54_021869 [Cotesia glomerata]
MYSKDRLLGWRREDQRIWIDFSLERHEEASSVSSPRKKNNRDRKRMVVSSCSVLVVDVARILAGPSLPCRSEEANAAKTSEHCPGTCRGKDQSEEATQRPVHTNSVLMLRNKRIEDPEFKLPHTISKSYRDRARPAATVTSDCFCFSSADVHVQVSRHKRQQKRVEVERWI